MVQVKEYIKNIIIDEGITSISVELFKQYTTLVSINLPNSLETIGTSSFDSCTSLTLVIVNGNLTKIEWTAFNNCKSLSYFLYKGRLEPTFSFKPFNGCENLKSIDVLYYYQSESFINHQINRTQPDFQEIAGDCGNNSTYLFTTNSNTLVISGE